MNIVAHLALLGWFPLVLGIFALLPPRRAVITAYLLGWLFLPMFGYSIRGLPDYGKLSATSVGVFLAAFIFDGRRMLSFRPRLVDLPMAVLCISPLFSSLFNDLGFYDGLSAVVDKLIMWGLPYFMGRVYFTDPAALQELALAIVIGGLLYVPLCWYEIRFSPQLHRIFYGDHPYPDFSQTIRFGGYRPTVFMQHGLALGMWMTATTLVAAWLCSADALRRLWGLPGWVFVITLLLTTIACKSVGAILLLFLGLATIYLAKWTRSFVPLLCLVLVVPAYMLLRSSSRGPAEALVATASTLVNPERAGSLQTRLDNETKLVKRALEKPLFGFGAWGGARVQNSITDGLWIITLGNYGMVGLIALTATMLLPLLVLRQRCPVHLWSHPAVAAPAVFALIVVLFMIDSLLNAMVNPIFTMLAGAVMAFGRVVIVPVPIPVQPLPSLEHGGLLDLGKTNGDVAMFDRP